jgi:hypothetical protein
MNKGKPNFKSQIMKQEHDMCKTRFQQNFSARILKKRKQGCDVKKKSKISVEQIESNVIFYPLFIPIGHLAQGSFSKNFQPTCVPCSTMCDPCVALIHPCGN